MSYEIRRGWPSNGALDEVIYSTDGTIKDGSFAILDADSGKWTLGECTTEASPVRAFVIGKESLRGTFVGLLSDAIIDLDSDHYTGTEFTVGDALAIDETGVLRAATDSDVTVAKVLHFGTDGSLRVLWAPTNF